MMEVKIKIKVKVKVNTPMAECVEEKSLDHLVHVSSFFSFQRYSHSGFIIL